MENPLKAARLSRGLTLEQVANLTGLSRQLIIRAEQGTYVHIPPGLINFYFNTTYERILAHEDYDEFQLQTRQANYGRLNPNYTFPKPLNLLHPFTAWRINSGLVSLMAPCRFFCLQHSLMFRWINNPEKSDIAVPSMLIKALTDAGYTNTLLENLQRANREFMEQVYVSNRLSQAGA